MDVDKKGSPIYPDSKVIAKGEQWDVYKIVKEFHKDVKVTLVKNLRDVRHGKHVFKAKNMEVI